jgi:hypothetical protein
MSRFNVGNFPPCSHPTCDEDGVIGTYIPSLGCNLPFCGLHQDAREYVDKEALKRAEEAKAKEAGTEPQMTQMIADAGEVAA